MYKILVNDFVEKKQTEQFHNLRFLDAKEICQELVVEFVTKLEGIRYLKKPVFYKKNALPKGYSIVDKSRDFYCKYTVFYKEPDGIVFSGNVKKIMSFMTFRHKPSPQVVIERPVPGAFSREFQAVIDQIAAIIPKNDEFKDN